MATCTTREAWECISIPRVDQGLANFAGMARLDCIANRQQRLHALCEKHTVTHEEQHYLLHDSVEVHFGLKRRTLGGVTGETSSLGESSLSYQSSHSPLFVHDSHPRVSKHEQIQLLISKLCDGQRFKGVGDRTKERAIARHDRKNIWRLRIKLSCFTLWVKSRRASLHVHVSVHWALLYWLNLLLHFFLSLQSGMRKLKKAALFKKNKAHLHTCSFISR